MKLLHIPFFCLCRTNEVGYFCIYALSKVFNNFADYIILFKIIISVKCSKRIRNLRKMGVRIKFQD